VKGFIPWLITQRPAVLSKDVLSQASYPAPVITPQRQRLIEQKEARQSPAASAPATPRSGGLGAMAKVLEALAWWEAAGFPTWAPVPIARRAPRR